MLFTYILNGVKGRDKHRYCNRSSVWKIVCEKNYEYSNLCSQKSYEHTYKHPLSTFYIEGADRYFAASPEYRTNVIGMIVPIK